MEYEQLVQLIGSVGFPIVCCGVMFWQNYRQSATHAEESKAFAEAIENNTLAISKLTSMLEGMK